jgi:hypothetical protein
MGSADSSTDSEPEPESTPAAVGPVPPGNIDPNKRPPPTAAIPPSFVLPAGLPPAMQANFPPLGMTPTPALQLMIQSGLTTHQQNPEVIKHMTEFLIHDSDNKLKLMSQTSERSHNFKKLLLAFLCFVTIVLISIPFIIIFKTGDINLAIDTIKTGATWIVPILLALVAGPSLKDLLK